MTEYTITINGPDEIDDISVDETEEEQSDGEEIKQKNDIRVEVNNTTNQCILYIINNDNGKECKLFLPSNNIPKSVTFNEDTNECSINIPLNEKLISVKVKETDDGYILS